MGHRQIFCSLVRKWWCQCVAKIATKICFYRKPGTSRHSQIDAINDSKFVPTLLWHRLTMANRWSNSNILFKCDCFYCTLCCSCVKCLFYRPVARSASNIVFSNGLMDPWSGGGVLRNQNDNIVVIIIPDSAHHMDLRASHPNDPHTIIETRDLERKTILNWISRDWLSINNNNQSIAWKIE